MVEASFASRSTMHAAPSSSFGQRPQPHALCRPPLADWPSSRARLQQRRLVSFISRPVVSCCGLTQHSSSSSNSSSDDGGGSLHDRLQRASSGAGEVGSSNPSLLHHHQQQQLQPFTPPAWHPRLYGLKRAGLEAAARSFYADVWNAGAHNALDELTTPGVCFHDALGADEGDLFSRPALRAHVAAFAAAHPLLRFDLEDVFVDAGRSAAVVHYTLTAARLLQHSAGSSSDSSSSSTGVVSCVRGVDTLAFDRATGRISGIVSVRERLAGELEEGEQQPQQEQEPGLGQAAAGWGVL